MGIYSVATIAATAPLMLACSPASRAKKYFFKTFMLFDILKAAPLNLVSALSSCTVYAYSYVVLYSSLLTLRGMGILDYGMYHRPHSQVPIYSSAPLVTLTGYVMEVFFLEKDISVMNDLPRI